MLRFFLLSCFLLRVSALELPEWSDRKTDSKNVGWFLTDPELTNPNYNLGKALEEGYNQQLKAWQEAYEQPLLNLALSSIHFSSNLPLSPDFFEKTEKELIQLNENQDFTIKAYWTNSPTGRFDSKLPAEVKGSMVFAIINPSSKPQVKLSFSQKLVDRFTPQMLYTITQSVEDFAMKHDTPAQKVKSIAEYLAIDIRALLKKDIPLSPIDIEALRNSYVAKSLPEEKPKTLSKIELPRPVLLGLAGGAALLALLLFFYLSGISRYFLPTKDIDSIKEKHRINTPPQSFQAPRGAFVTDMVRFDSTYTESNKGRDRLL